MEVHQKYQPVRADVEPRLGVVTPLELETIISTVNIESVSYNSKSGARVHCAKLEPEEATLALFHRLRAARDIKQGPSGYGHAAKRIKVAIDKEIKALSRIILGPMVDDPRVAWLNGYQLNTYLQNLNYEALSDKEFLDETTDIVDICRALHPTSCVEAVTYYLNSIFGLLAMYRLAMKQINSNFKEIEFPVNVTLIIEKRFLRREDDI